MNRAYFDNSATTTVDPRVLESMIPYFTDRYGNASSLHSFGREANAAMESSRQQVAKAINADPSEIIFTSGGTESDNIAVQGAMLANLKSGDHMITSAIEHPAILEVCKHLRTQGVKVTYLPVDPDGLISLERLKGSLTSRTVLVSIMAANNEIGTIQPFREIGKIATDSGVLFHSDAVQAVTKVPIDVKKDNIDMMSLAAHKFHGPKGVGALYIRKGVKVRPLVYGGGHERGLRSSTENIPGIVGMGTAISISMNEMRTNVERMGAMRDHMIDTVLRDIPGSYLNGHRTQRLCNNAHFRFDFIEGESLIMSLDLKGFATSTGSACSSKDLEPSYVLTSLGIRKEQCHGSLRVTLSRTNTSEEVDSFLSVLPTTVANLREMSPIKDWNDYREAV